MKTKKPTPFDLMFNLSIRFMILGFIIGVILDIIWMWRNIGLIDTTNIVTTINSVPAYGLWLLFIGWIIAILVAPIIHFDRVKEPSCCK